MLIILSLVLTIILDSILVSNIIKLLITLADFSLFRGSSSVEVLILTIPLLVIMPAIWIYVLLRKLNFDQKLQRMKAVKVIFATLLALFVLYVLLLLLSTTIRGGGITFAIKIIFATYALPVMILLFIIALVMIIKRLVKSRGETYEHIPLSSKERGFVKYTSFISVLAVLGALFNPYGNIVKNFQQNDTFQQLCLNAKTTIYEDVDLDSLFLYTAWQSRYCKIDKFDSYHRSGGGILPYPKLVLDTNITFETKNKNKDTEKEFKYRYYDVKNYRYGVESKTIKSKYGYIEEQIYNENSIVGKSVKIIKLDDNETIAESIYYVSLTTKKVCGDMYCTEKFGDEKCLKPFYLVLDMIEKTNKD